MRAIELLTDAVATLVMHRLKLVLTPFLVRHPYRVIAYRIRANLCAVAVSAPLTTTSFRPSLS